MRSHRRQRAQLGALVLAIVCTYAYFLPRPAWNQNSRLALTRAIVEHGTVTIDPYHATTGDKSFREGHFYCDKAPGTSLLAVPAYAGFVLYRKAVGAPLPRFHVEPLDQDEAKAGKTVDFDEMQPGDHIVYDLGHRLALWVCNLGSVVAISALGLVAIYALARRFSGVPPPLAHRAGMLAVVTYGLATPAFPYATSFYGHRLCADFLLLAAALIFVERPNPPGAPDDRRMGWWAGTALGWAVLCEYPAAVPVVILTAAALWHRGLHFTLRVAAAGALWAVVLAGYHTAAFGHPLATGYDFVYLPEFAEGMKIRYGIHAPDPSVLLQLTFGSYRGLFYLAPVTLLAVWGWVVGTRRAMEVEDRAAPVTLPWPLALLTGLVCAYYLALNSGYYMWDGGAAFGPRHTIPMLGFLALGAGLAAARIPTAFVPLLAISIVQMMLGALAGPEAPGHGDPIWAYALPAARSGGMGVAGGSIHDVGHLMGLRGLWSLGPLALLWLAIVPWRAPDPD